MAAGDSEGKQPCSEGMVNGLFLTFFGGKGYKKKQLNKRGNGFRKEFAKTGGWRDEKPSRRRSRLQPRGRNREATEVVVPLVLIHDRQIEPRRALRDHEGLHRAGAVLAVADEKDLAQLRRQHLEIPAVSAGEIQVQ